MAAEGSTSTSTGTCSTCPYEGTYWPWITGVTGFWQQPGKKAAPAPQAPAIAIVDSGVDASNTIFGGRVVKQVTLTQLGNNSSGDGYGHGTYVAGLAAGMLVNSWGGASPTSKLVSLDVMNDQGMALTSDVIAAADWIYQNRSAYNIRVANFSLHSSGRASWTIRSTRRSRSCGSAGLSWSRPQGTTRTTVSRAACSTRPQTIPSC
jgi:hypothetical protein